MITWVLYLCIGIVIGGMAGFYFAKLDDFSKKQKQELEDKLNKTEQELVEYKDQVTAHFIETANLINNMTESYQKVHEHLAKGSVELCNNAVEVNKLTVSSDQLLSAQKSGSNAQDAGEVTNLAESSEAPKTITVENNNNKSEVEAAEVTELAKSGSSDSAAADTVSDTTADSSTDTTASSDEAQPQSSKASSSASSSASSMENPVLETMAVADEEETAQSSQDDEPNKNMPGSRMVH